MKVNFFLFFFAFLLLAFFLLWVSATTHNECAALLSCPGIVVGRSTA